MLMRENGSGFSIFGYGYSGTGKSFTLFGMANANLYERIKGSFKQYVKILDELNFDYPQFTKTEFVINTLQARLMSGKGIPIWHINRSHENHANQEYNYGMFTDDVLDNLVKFYAQTDKDIDTDLKGILENNPDIKMNLASIMSAEGQALQAGLRPNPQAIMELENFGGDDDFSGVDGAELTLGVEQEIEIAGKRTYRKDVANYALAAAKQEAVSQI